MLNSTRSIVVALISFMFMAVFEVNRAQELTPSPAPTLPSNDGAAIDQGIAYLLLLVALAIIYLVPPFLVRKIFMQTFSFINKNLFNSLMMVPDSRNFVDVKAWLSNLEHWCYKTAEEVLLYEKPESTWTPDEICPILNIKQQYLIRYGLSSFFQATWNTGCDMDSENADSSFLLLLDDELPRVPFSDDDLIKSMDEINIEDIEFPRFINICEDEGFNFL
ncbi:hypothetical protein LXL04_018758 [Taraxacum kok-saghyz]